MKVEFRRKVHRFEMRAYQCEFFVGQSEQNLVGNRFPGTVSSFTNLNGGKRLRVHESSTGARFASAGGEARFIPNRSQPFHLSASRHLADDRAYPAFSAALYPQHYPCVRRIARYITATHGFLAKTFHENHSFRRSCHGPLSRLRLLPQEQCLGCAPAAKGSTVTCESM